ncbi:unnamed protein product [Lota lota]
MVGITSALIPFDMGDCSIKKDTVGPAKPMCTAAILTDGVTPAPHHFPLEANSSPIAFSADVSRGNAKHGTRKSSTQKDEWLEEKPSAKQKVKSPRDVTSLGVVSPKETAQELRSSLAAERVTFNEEVADMAEQRKAFQTEREHIRQEIDASRRERTEHRMHREGLQRSDGTELQCEGGLPAAGVRDGHTEEGLPGGEKR